MKQSGESLADLVSIMSRLRQPDGCPWDGEQTHQSLKRYLLEEVYEVLDAIEKQDDAMFCDELGDLLLQVVFHAQIAAEQGRFTIDDVVEGICAKMIRRHPHVFADAEASTSADVLTAWEAIKRQEKQSEAEKKTIMNINDNLPALLFTQKVQDKATRVGFDWPDIEGPKQKVAEEMDELFAATTPEEQAEEFGDALFAMVNVATFLNLDAEDCMKHAAKKFIRRFAYLEGKLQKQGRDWPDTNLAELDGYWEEIKQIERDQDK